MLDNEIIPKRGIRFHLGSSWDVDIENTNRNYGRLESQFSIFFKLPFNIIYGGNVKGVSTFNNFEFYQAATLGAQNRSANNAEIRGLRRDRFTGKSA